MAEAVKIAKEHYLSTKKAGNIRPKRDHGVPGEIKAHPDIKKKLYQEYRKNHAGKKANIQTITGAAAQIPLTTKIERVKSGIPGLDDLVEGGFRRNSTVLVVGGPGCGKTTLLLQFLYEGTLIGEPGLFISFEETIEDLLYDYGSFDWDIRGKMKDKLLYFQEYQPHQVKNIMEQGGGMIRDLIKDAGIKRIAIDSLTSFAMLFESEYEKRINMLHFFGMLESWGCTILLTSERTATFDISFEESGLEFLVDGTILLYNIRKGNTREQALEVLKMRATDIVKKICPITISSSGITVFTQAEVFSAFD